MTSVSRAVVPGKTGVIQPTAGLDTGSKIEITREEKEEA